MEPAVGVGIEELEASRELASIGSYVLVGVVKE